MTFKQKKGDIFQILFMLTLLVGVAIIGVILLVMTTNINNFWEESGLLNDTVAGRESLETMQRTAPRTTDYVTFFLFMGMIIGVTISAVRTDFNAITIILFIFVMIISIFMAAGFVNIYRGIALAEGVSEISSDLTLTNFIFSKYTPLITAALCALIMIIMYGKGGGEIIR